MRQIFATKYKRTLSVFTVVALILQSLLPSSFLGIPSALAATQAYTFATPGNYSTDSATVIASDDDVAMFNLTWNADEGDGLPTSDNMNSLLAPASMAAGLVLATTSAGSLEHSSDYGANFTTVTPASWNAVDIVVSSGDIDSDLIAVGNGASNKAYYSDDAGATWTGSATGFIVSFTSVTHDGGDNHTWAGATDGTVWRSTDGGDIWTSQGASGLDSITDILWYSGNTVIASGLKTSVTAVAYSTDSGATWTLGSLPGSPPTALENTKMAMNGTTLYLGHTGYVATFSFDGQTADDMTTSSNWTDISANISGDIGTFTDVGGFMSSSGIMFISLYDSAASQPRVVSTLDDGTDWIKHAPSDGFTTPAEIVRMNDGRILWGITDSSGNAETLMSEHYGVGDSAIALTGMSAGSFESIDVVYHSKSETDEITMALGMSTGETDTWYYHNGTSWVGDTTDSYLKASGEVVMDANLDRFDEEVTITGDVYLKIYQHEIDSPVTAPPFTYSFTIIDSITIAYNSPAGGGNPQPDTQYPVSQVDSLPIYSTSPFTVTVQATDDNSGVAEVSLWYSFDREPGPFEGDVTLVGTETSGNGSTYTFEVDAPEDGPYYFVSSAKDVAGNDNAPTKPINLEPWSGGVAPPNPEIEAETIVDTVNPYIVKKGQSPKFNETDVAIDGTITVKFSEKINTQTFQLALYEGQSDQGTDRSDLLGVHIWDKKNKKIKIEYAGLNENSWYTAKVITAKDLAGNNVHPGSGDPNKAPLYAKWSFLTVPPQDPNITNSKIIVLNDTGDFEVGDTVQYRVELINTGFLTAEDAFADLDFVTGLTYADYAQASSGELTLKITDGETTGWRWDGAIASEGQQIIFIDFNVTINSPAQELELTQAVEIGDGINPPIFREVVIFIAEDTNFNTATKTVDEEVADVGETLTYTVSFINTGPTVGYVEVNDPIPAGTAYQAGYGVVGTDNWDTLAYSTETNSIVGTIAMLPVNVPVSFIFKVTITDEIDSIVNTATIQGGVDDVNPDVPVEVTATTAVNTSPLPPNNPPIMRSQTPRNNAQVVPLESTIVIVFNEPILTSSFDYTVSRLYGPAPDTTEVWSENDTIVTITPSNNLEIDETYTVQILDAQDTNGNPFVLGDDVANPWEFITVYPTVEIIVPAFDPTMLVNTTRTYNPETGEYEDMQFFVGLHDFYATGTPYFVESGSVDIYFGFSEGSNGAIGLTPNFTNPVDYVTIYAGESQTGFYYRDTVVSFPNYASITPFEIIDPEQGWADVTKNIQITSNDAPPEPHLTTTISSQTININETSGPITVGAQSGTQPTYLPDRLFFHTQSTGGTFLHMDPDTGNLVSLPERIIVQDSNPTERLQYYITNTDGPRYSVTFYYRDNASGSPVLTISDNAPLTPDTGNRNVSFVMSVINDEEEELILEEELEEVEDDTGRIITTVEVAPVDTYLLPNGVQTFAAKGFDQDEKEIKELKFKWYILAGGGTVQKNGLSDDNHKTAFVADDQTGAYFDTVMVATFYNGEIGYATASVYIVDITAIGGPTALPVTGMSGLQLIFILLTLSAAVALAWVESYEKQHFSAHKK